MPHDPAIGGSSHRKKSSKAVLGDHKLGLLSARKPILIYRRDVVPIRSSISVFAPFCLLLTSFFSSFCRLLGCNFCRPKFH